MPITGQFFNKLCQFFKFLKSFGLPYLLRDINDREVPEWLHWVPELHKTNLKMPDYFFGKAPNKGNDPKCQSFSESAKEE